MDIAHLSNQQVYTLCGIAAYLTVFAPAIAAAAIIGTVQRLKAGAGRKPPVAERSRVPSQVPSDGTPVAA